MSEQKQSVEERCDVARITLDLRGVKERAKYGEGGPWNAYTGLSADLEYSKRGRFMVADMDSLLAEISRLRERNALLVEALQEIAEEADFDNAMTRDPFAVLQKIEDAARRALNPESVEAPE